MTFLNKLLTYYDLTLDEYHDLIKAVSTEDLWEIPVLQKKYAKIPETIQKAIHNKSKIVIYGDYDTDGILATAILVQTFQKLAYPVGYYIPSRYLDGYGLTCQKVEEFHAKGYQLIITVDNGVTAFEAIARAYELGMQVIITDHHQMKATLPQNEGFIHPTNLNEAGFPSCGAVMSLVLSALLLNRYDEYFITLAGVATLADLMPLKKVNRTLLRLAINYLNSENYLPFYLLNEKGEYDETDLSMRIIPSINAIGRIIETSQINRLVPYFSNEELNSTKEVAKWIKLVNERRKILTTEALNEPIQEGVNSLIYFSFSSPGINGLLATRFANEYQKPALVLSAHPLEKNQLIGSLRTPGGYNLSNFLQSEEVKSLLLQSGGHASAAGITLLKDHKNAFSTIFERYFEAMEPLDEEEPKCISFTLEEMTFPNYEILKSFRPFGQEFTEPLFKLENYLTTNLTFIKDGKYLSTQLPLNRQLLSFKYGKNNFEANKEYNFYGTLNINIFRNIKNLVFKIEKIQK